MDSSRRGRLPAPRLAGLATLGLDWSGRVVRWSPGARDLFGVSAAGVLGRDVRELLGRHGHSPGAAPDWSPGGAAGADQARALLDAAVDAVVAAALATVGAGQVWSGVMPARCAGGADHEVEFRWEPSAGTPGAAVLVSAALAEDAATARRRRERHELLAATIGLGDTLDLAVTAREMAAASVPLFADAAAVYLLESVVSGERPPSGLGLGPVEVRRLAAKLAGGDALDGDMPPLLDEVMVFPADSAFARCVNQGQPMLFETLEPRIRALIGRRAPGSHPICQLLAPSSFLALPLRAPNGVLGFAAFARRPDRPGFGADDVELGLDLAARAALGIDNARLYTRERQTAKALQTNLLPRRVAVPPGFEVAHRCLAAGDGVLVGGDWFDVMALPDGRVGIVVGDAMGHGIAAAAAMSQLRMAARACASLGLSPGEVLGRLDEMARALGDTQVATCVFLRCDPATGTGEIASAGHLPPLLAHPDGSTEQAPVNSSLPLGIGAGPPPTVELRLPLDSTLVLYTDGLVETRCRDVDHGIAALRAALTAHCDKDLERSCDAVLRELRGNRRQDDVTLVLVRRGLLAKADEPDKADET